MAIPSNATNADAAFLLRQWLTSQAPDTGVTRAGGAPLRNSTLRDAELVRQYPEFITFREALKYSNPDWRPIISVWDRINVQALGVGISEALTGRKTAEAALKGVVPVVEQIMRHDVIGSLLEQEPELASDVVFGIQATEFLESRFGDHVLECWASGRPSLLEDSRRVFRR